MDPRISYLNNIHDILNTYQLHSNFYQMPEKSSKICEFWQPWINNNDDALNNKHYTSKQAPPTTKWKRERRSRLPEYTRKSDPKLPENLPPELQIDHLDESNNSNNSSTSSSLSLSPKSTTPTADGTSVVDTPLDMSIRQRGLPPTYSQAISNSTYRISSFRPSVITQAQTVPPVHHQDNGKYISSSKLQNYVTESKSISMCDPIIDEHFRRSLGKDYAILFSNNNVVTTTPSPPPTTTVTTTTQLINRTTPVVEAHNNIKKITLTSSTKKQHLTKTTNATTEQENGIIASFKEMMDTDTASLSVDDHFAKALGDTWFKLNQKENELNQKKNLKSEKNENSIRVVTI